MEIPEDLVKSMGLISASIQYLLEDRVDLVSSLAVATAERYKLVDFTKAIYVGQYYIVQPMPELESPLFLIFTPFSPLVTITLRNM